MSAPILWVILPGMMAIILYFFRRFTRLVTTIRDPHCVIISSLRLVASNWNPDRFGTLAAIALIGYH